jgi:hypothetical protein
LRKTVSAGSIGNEQLISAWMISDRATATDREFLDALIEIGLDLQLQTLVPLQNAPWIQPGHCAAKAPP